MGIWCRHKHKEYDDDTLLSLRDMDGQMPVRVFMRLTPTDMRCGFGTLAQLAREREVTKWTKPLHGNGFIIFDG